MALCSQMNNVVNVDALQNIEHQLKVADIGFNEEVIDLILNILEVCQITSICRFVHVVDVVLRVFIHKQPHHVISNKSGSVGNNYVCIFVCIFGFVPS